MSSSEKPKKIKGPIRTEAVIPAAIIIVLTGLYFSLLFDSNLKSAMEWAGFKALGAEVNIAKVKTSFANASISIQGIDITDSENPNVNSISIGDVRFSMLWDALLRAKVLVNEMAVEGIAFQTPRKSPGRLAPPPPPEKTGPSALETEGAKLKDAAIEKTKAEYNDNVLGDIAAILGGGNSDDQLNQLKQNLPSKKLVDDLEKNLNERKRIWDEKLKTLPQGKEIQSLGDRLNKVKFKDFKSADELQKSLQELDSIFKDADQKYKTIDSVQKLISEDLAKTQQEYQALEQQIKVDTKSLEEHFRIPKIDAKSLTLSLLKKYTGPYEAKIARYKALADKYLPPKFLKKGKKEASEKDEQLVVHPREKGVTYEFGRANAYPAFWIKRIGISSQAGASPYSGNIQGEVLDISSNQKVTGKATLLKIAGDFPSAALAGLAINAAFDNRTEPSKISYNMKVESYQLAAKQLVESKDASVGFNKALAGLELNSQLVGLKDFKMNLRNEFSKVDYSIKAENQNLDEILKKVFAGISVLNLTVTGSGQFPNVNLEIDSNLGSELQKGFEVQIQAKISEARAKIQKAVDEQIGQQKAKIESQINQTKTQVESEVKKIQDQLNGQKKQAESKVDAAKKDTENQAKKKLESDGQKTLDDLKKKLGF